MTATMLMSFFNALTHGVVGLLLCVLVAVIAWGYPRRRPSADGFGIDKENEETP